MLTQRCFNVDAYDKLSAVNTFYLCNQFVLVPHLVKEGNHEAIHRLKPFDSTLVNWSRQKKVFLTIRTWKHPGKWRHFLLLNGKDTKFITFHPFSPLLSIFDFCFFACGVFELPVLSLWSREEKKEEQEEKETRANRVLFSAPKTTCAVALLPREGKDPFLVLYQNQHFFCWTKLPT